MRIYDTLAAKSFVKNADGQLDTLVGLKDNTALFMDLRKGIKGLTNQADDSIVQWNLPLFDIETNCVFVDARPYLSRDGGFKDKHNYLAMADLAELELLWNTERSDFEFVANDISALFANWMSEAFKQRLGISALDAVTVKLLAFTYYSSIFIGADSLSRMTEDRLISTMYRGMTRYLNSSDELIKDVLSDERYKEYLTSPINVRNLVEVLQEMCSTPLGQMTPVSLMQMLAGGAWMGKDHSTLSAAMIQHPPVLCSMVIQQLRSGTFKRTSVGSAVETNRRRLDLANVKRLVNQ